MDYVTKLSPNGGSPHKNNWIHARSIPPWPFILCLSICSSLLYSLCVAAWKAESCWHNCRCRGVHRCGCNCPHFLSSRQDQMTSDNNLYLHFCFWNIRMNVVDEDFPQTTVFVNDSWHPSFISNNLFNDVKMIIIINSSVILMRVT